MPKRAEGHIATYGWSGRTRGAGGGAGRRSVGLLSDEGGQLMVVAGADRLGFVAWRKAVTSQSSYCWNIGAQLLPEGRGRGTGTQAQRLLVRYLFAHTPVVRIEADPETANIAEQRALEKSGFAPTDRTRPSLPTTGGELWLAAIPGSEESRQGGGR
ncbi:MULTISPECIES: GNAT family N-acetyltransferase [unclassified Streptomyces]|uniref:GNAT family N-acetyltransferase n=1 Tax=unclassified Streptomyces TaxID=2593676 RepID=UPI000A75A1ED|nr:MULTISPECIES: GNAT family protein [unclassified Streptomyces]